MPGALPAIPVPLHPDGERDLVYLGIARSGPSGATLRSRVVGNHIGGTTGQSTLRRSLASVLYQQEGWRSRFTDAPLLVAEDEARLNDRMQEGLAVSWAGHEQPWTVEAAVIAPADAAEQSVDELPHPLYRHVGQARQRWRQTARLAVLDSPGTGPQQGGTDE